MTQQRILVVDDNPLNLGVLVDHLEIHGYEVLVALGGLEALERIGYVQPDLVLLDIMMPDLDGFETCRRLKQQDHMRDVPVIFMTALTDVDSKVKAFGAGGVDYVSKPFQVEELLARVRTHLALREAQQGLRDSELRHRRLFETAGDGILVLDCEEGTVHDLNSQCAQMLDVRSSEVRGRRVEDVAILERLSGGTAMVDALRATGQMKWEEWSWEKADGTAVSVEVVGTTYRAGTRLLAQCTFRDVLARKEAEARVRYLALHDALTGLPNRTLLLDRLNQAMAHARRDQTQVALLLLDLDHFKHINDSLGHLVGDGLLEEVSRRIRSVLRETDTPARLGGDEFVIAASGLTDVADAEGLAQRILEVLQPSAVIQGHHLRIGTSIGIAMYPGDGDNPAALLQAADTAMYQAKKKGRGTYRLFTRDLSMAAERWHTLSNDLHGACERGEFVLHYQPQYSLDKSRITGVEALIRWQHPSEGTVPPGLFIPLLEEHGKMVEVGRWVLRTACAQNVAWQTQGLPPLRMAVNLSAQQFYRGDIIRTVREALDDTGLKPEWLELELTESLTLDDTEATMRIMHDLKAMGVKLSLDDFGTGWSSLSYLKRFPLDRIKIDRSFVRDMMNDNSTAAIVHSILDLARQLDLDCVAEGVETEEQLDHLREERCPGIQGFLLSRAIPAGEVPALLGKTVGVKAA
ncbi:MULTISPECIES: bifunctional diguanylate cyclase/phosphodiesterase [Asticcacaulis]|uniref:putative bifunctional diguanylate cyclase/phosphodiesterase n=1 Tax=Asticcacaulis TaxID=76890 RepID=UPI001AE93987|nr:MULTISPECIES: EAL domain-containing protein [Asticcacaulis]MBP2157948.1 diguanylate cyclase (GGDEF)-like protein/PAS domain S-box-containing protein [Asticcacaulis solisilvae]MDR6798993.1 diguanylate cyclase (GGDEF)-like protein/PAS domain S-box-containing protein [Asticcacaulis sp. BE141]